MAVSTPLPFLAAPIRHLGESVGAFYVGEKDVEFTPEDKETLVMFASQAALVIANARRHRDEQRARADLETLVNTTPMGVLVFDAKTGGVTSVNREARRIVSGLHTQPHLTGKVFNTTAEGVTPLLNELLEVAWCKRVFHEDVKGAG